MVESYLNIETSIYPQIYADYIDEKIESPGSEPPSTDSGSISTLAQSRELVVFLMEFNASEERDETHYSHIVLRYIGN